MPVYRKLFRSHDHRYSRRIFIIKERVEIEFFVRYLFRRCDALFRCYISFRLSGEYIVHVHVPGIVCSTVPSLDCIYRFRVYACRFRFAIQLCWIVPAKRGIGSADMIKFVPRWSREWTGIAAILKRRKLVYFVRTKSYFFVFSRTGPSILLS